MRSRRSTIYIYICFPPPVTWPSATRGARASINTDLCGAPPPPQSNPAELNPTCDRHTYMHSFDRIRNTKSKICKLVYINMHTSIVQQPDKVFNKWKNYFNNDLSIDILLNSFEIIYNCTTFIYLHIFHFKLLHQILANNEALIQMDIDRIRFM